MIVGIWLRRPLFRADYDETVRRANVVNKWMHNDVSVLNIEGLCYLFNGRTLDSERVHRQFVAQTLKLKYYQALALNNLAAELTLQKRYEEALAILEITIHMHPEFASTYDTLAGWYLQQNLYPERALELAQFGFELKPPQLTIGKKASKSVRLATRAWAEAKTGMIDQAKSTLKQAFKISDPNYVPIYAELHRLAGETALVCSEEGKAKTYFQKAATLDPNGRIGQLAKDMLNQMSQSSGRT